MFLGGSLLTERGQDDVERGRGFKLHLYLSSHQHYSQRYGDANQQISPLGKHHNVQTDFAVNYKRGMFQQIIWKDDYSNQNFVTGTFKMNF